VFVPGKPSEPSLIFARKAGAYSGDNLYNAPLHRRLLEMVPNIRPA
jgi:hypothetical protein